MAALLTYLKPFKKKIIFEQFVLTAKIQFEASLSFLLYWTEGRCWHVIQLFHQNIQLLWELILFVVIVLIRVGN